MATRGVSEDTARRVLHLPGTNAARAARRAAALEWETMTTLSHFVLCDSLSYFDMEHRAWHRQISFPHG